MKSLILAKDIHLLYKDEINDTFLITKYMEIYKASNQVLRCICWSFQTVVKLRSMGVIYNEWFTDDRLYLFDCNIENLSILIECGTTKRRIYKNGKKLHYLEKKLGHRITPFNPTIKE